MRKCFPTLNRTDPVFQSKLSIMSLHPHVAEPETAFSVQCTVHVRKCSLAVVAATLRLITLTLSVLLLLKCGFVSREAVSFFVTRHRSCSDAKFCCVCHVVHIMLSFMSCCVLLQAFDADATRNSIFQFSIRNDPQGFFSIDSTTGECGPLEKPKHIRKTTS